MEPLLVVEGLKKTYRGNWILDSKRAVVDVSFQVSAGEVVGLLGPNGCGKSTTFKAVTGLIRPSGGRITLFGMAPTVPASRARLGFLPEDAAFHDFLTAEEYVDMAARLVGVPSAERKERVASVLYKVGLADARKRRIRTYSKGMTQRVGIAQAIVGRPDLVILDEPMTGLDPVGRHEVRDLITGLARDGAGVVFSTHILQDVELACDRVIIMVAGRVVRQGSLQDLLSDQADGPVEVTVRGMGAGDADSAAGIDAELVSRSGDTLVFRALGPDSAERLVQEVRFRGGHVIAIVPLARRLEDAFLKELETAGARR